MKKYSHFLKLGGLISSLFLFSNCALFLFGGGVAGGMAVSKDTIEGHPDEKIDKVWKASREVMMKEGFIRLEDKAHGLIDGEVRKSQVKIDIRQLTSKTVRIQVKARKSAKLLPDIKLANELYLKIAEKLD